MIRLLPRLVGVLTQCDITAEFRWRGRRTQATPDKAGWEARYPYLQRIVTSHFALNRAGRGGRVRTRSGSDGIILQVALVSGRYRSPFWHTVRVVGLPAPAPWKTPQSAHREDGGEEPEHADRDQRPDKEEVSASIDEPAGDADTLRPLHVDDRNDQRKEREEKRDDVPRSPFEEHQRSEKPDDGDEHPAHQVWEPSRFVPVYDVARQVKRKEEDQE